MAARGSSEPSARLSLRQLLVVVTCTAVLFGMAKLRPLPIALIAPGVLGPLIAHSVCPSRGALFVGLISAYFWSGLILLFTAPVLAFVYMASHDAPIEPIKTTALVAVIVGGLLGGVVGARFGLSRLAESAEPNDARDGESSE